MGQHRGRLTQDSACFSFCRVRGRRTSEVRTDARTSAILADDDTSAALLTIAADASTWLDLYLASLEEGGLLRPESDLPPIRERDEVISLMAVLASGILIGPGGSEIREEGNLEAFFDQVRTWYGHEPQLAEIEDWEPRCFYSMVQPVPALPSFEDYDLGLSSPTHFETRDGAY